LVIKSWVLLTKYLFGDLVKAEIPLGKFVFFPNRAGSTEIAGSGKITACFSSRAKQELLFFLGAFI
jgi:hypothetical protein